MGLLDIAKRVVNATYQFALVEQARQMEKAGRDAKEQSARDLKIDGKSLSQWEASWRSIGTLESAELSPLRNSIGIYQARLDGTVVYVGRAVEVGNGGFRKRLRDYTRESDSARRTEAGRSMHANADRLQIAILETDTVEGAKTLERFFIGKYQPLWNKMLR